MARQGVGDLDSGDPEGWKRARAIFDHFREAEPRSAFPLIYLAQACEKLSDIMRVNLLIEQAATCPDFDEALGRRLKENPTSVTLLVARSEWLIARKQYAEAEALLEKARGIEPTHRGAMVTSGNLERARGNYDRAILHLRAAIDSASREPGTGARIFKRRLILLPLLSKLVGMELEKGDAPLALEHAAGLLDELAREIAVIDRDAGLYSDVPGVEKWDFSRNYYLGVVESGLGLLDRRRSDLGPAGVDAARLLSADRHFDASRKFFDLSARAIIAGSPNASILQATVDDRRRELDSRSGPRH